MEGSTPINAIHGDVRKRSYARHDGLGHPFGMHRDMLDNRFVYASVCARARGLTLGINMCPDKLCNFNCVYCEVDRSSPPTEQTLDLNVMADELKRTLDLVRSGHLRDRSWYHSVPDEFLSLRHVALSGDGEPTLSPIFGEALQAVVHVRALGGEAFKLVLYTNGSGLDVPAVRHALKLLTRTDEIWIKLDAGTQAYLNKVNRASVPLDKLLANILEVARTRPVVIQSLFPLIGGEEPPLDEVEQYAATLSDLARSGARISSVQVYSANRPSPNSDTEHLPLKVLSRIAKKVRKGTGLNTEVF